MKSIARWLVYGFLAAVAAAVAAFPAAESESSGHTIDPLAKSIQEARMRFNTQSELLRREHSRELAREVKTARPTGEGGLYEVVRPSDVPASVEARVRTAADAMFRSLPRRDSAVRVVIRLVLDTGSTLAGAPVNRAGALSSTDIFVPADSSDRVCAIILRVQQRNALSSRRMTLGADPCYWFKAYGMPGRGMRGAVDALQGAILGDHGRRDSYRSDSTFFRALAHYDMRVMECMTSMTAACERLATERTTATPSVQSLLRTPGWTGYGRTYVSYNEVLPALLLTEIEREVGPVRFRQIWTSDAPLPVAFAEATGVPLGQWVHELISSQTARRTGPLPATRGWLVLLIAIPSFFALGTWGASRRSAVV